MPSSVRKFRCFQNSICRIAIGAIASAFALVGYAGDNYQEKLPQFLDAPKNLTPFWAQEFIGADFSRQFIKEQKALGSLKSEPIPVAIVEHTDFLNAAYFSEHSEIQVENSSDSPEKGSSKAGQYSDSEHATAVAHLIAGFAPVGAGESIRLTKLINSESDNAIQGLDEADAKKTKVFNLSVAINTDGEISDKLKKLGQKALLVLSAGNEFPLSSGTIKNSLPGLFVASLRPDGLVSEFSSPSNRVDIAAPSNWEIASVKNFTEVSKFGGTSGATPLVTAVAANVYLFLPEASPGFIGDLLKATSIPLPVLSSKNSQNGKGMLNAYKAVRVAERIRNKFKDTKMLVSFAPDQLQQFFDFSNEIKALMLIAQKKILSKDPKEKIEALELFRKVILLASPDDFFESSNKDEQRKLPLELAISVLSREYRNKGFERNAVFFENLLHSNARKYIEDGAKKLNKDSNVEQGSEENSFLGTRDKKSIARAIAITFDSLDLIQFLSAEKKSGENTLEIALQELLAESDWSDQRVWNYLTSHLKQIGRNSKIDLVGLLEIERLAAPQFESPIIELLGHLIKDYDRYVFTRALFHIEERFRYNNKLRCLVAERVKDRDSQVADLAKEFTLQNPCR